MRKIFWNFLLTFALALGAFSSSAREVSMPMRGDCCETLCSEMPACANMWVCQACIAPAAHLAHQRNLAPLRTTAFPYPGDDRTITEPVFAIWTPPD